MSKRRAPNGSGSWYRLPSGAIRVEISVRNADGKLIRRTRNVKGGPGEVARKNEALRQLREAHPGGRLSVAPKTVGECLDDWTTHYLNNVSGSTRDNYRIVARHLAVLASIPLDELTTGRVNALLKEMAAAPRSAGRVGYSKGTIRLTRKVLSMALAHAKSEGQVTENAALDSKVPEAAERKSRTLTNSEITAIREAAKGDRLEAAWLIQVALGLRPGETLALAWDDVDGDLLHVSHSQRREGGKLYPRDHQKTEASARVLEIPPVVASAIEERRIAQESEDPSPIGLIFTNPDGSPIRPENYRRQFLSLLERAKVATDGLSPHVLRHSCASHLVDQGVPLGVVSDLLGHSDMGQLVRTYRHSTSAVVRGHTAAMNTVLAPSEVAASNSNGSGITSTVK
jgi:integrase